MNGHLYLALAQGNNFGWGICSHYIEQELRTLNIPLTIVDDTTPARVDGTVFHALANRDFNTLWPTRGSRNIGYTFFENELTDQSIRNAADYDLILGGSSWCYKKMLEAGISNCGILLQGIDPLRFHAVAPKEDGNLFIVFSGGKFELRKGQDLVLSAFRIIQEKYSDIILLNMWYNFWPETMAMFQHSRHIMFSPHGDSWDAFMHHLYKINGLDPSRIITLGAIDNDKLASVYAKTDVGIFPNRCEGGTNLVLMEYMACGKPVIASNTSGHTDVVSRSNSLLLDELAPYPIYDPQKSLWADWEEPSVEQIVEQIEYAYHHRAEIKQLGDMGNKDMQRFTWTQTAKALLRHIEQCDPVTSQTIRTGHTCPCPICKKQTTFLDALDFNRSCEEERGVYLFPAGIPVRYYLCDECGFCFAPELCTWSRTEFAEKIYNDEYARVDPDYNDNRPRINAENLFNMFDAHKQSIIHLDYGGGDGLLSHILRTHGFKSTSYDPFVDSKADLKKSCKYNLITAFEVFEHVPSVPTLMRTLTSLLADEGVILFSTLLSDGYIERSKRLNWWYAAPRNGHISLYAQRTLSLLAVYYNLNFASFSNGFHVFWRTLPSWAHHLVEQRS